MTEDQDSPLNLPELITKQQDLIQRLQRQLATAERDAANEAWVRKQLMQSFSWRLTSPVRLAAQMRHRRKRFADALSQLQVLHLVGHDPPLVGRQRPVGRERRRGDHDQPQREHLGQALGRAPDEQPATMNRPTRMQTTAVREREAT